MLTFFPGLNLANNAACIGRSYSMTVLIDINFLCGYLGDSIVHDMWSGLWRELSKWLPISCSMYIFYGSFILTNSFYGLLKVMRYVLVRKYLLVVCGTKCMPVYANGFLYITLTWKWFNYIPVWYKFSIILW